MRKEVILNYLEEICTFFERFLNGYIGSFLICVIVSMVFDDICRQLGATLDFTKEGVLLCLGDVRGFMALTAIAGFTVRMVRLIFEMDTDRGLSSYVSGFFSIMLWWFGFALSLESFVSLCSEGFKEICVRKELTLFFESKCIKIAVVFCAIWIVFKILKEVCGYLIKKSRRAVPGHEDGR